MQLFQCVMIPTRVGAGKQGADETIYVRASDTIEALRRLHHIPGYRRRHPLEIRPYDDQLPRDAKVY